MTKNRVWFRFDHPLTIGNPLISEQTGKQIGTIVGCYLHPEGHYEVECRVDEETYQKLAEAHNRGHSIGAVAEGKLN